MAKSKIITGLDIGSGIIKLIVAARKNGEESLEILSQVEAPSFGVRKGVVIDVDKVSLIVQSLLNKIKLDSGQKIDSAYINISGGHIFSTSSHGTVAVSRADGKISQEDVERVLQAAQTFSLPFNKEILDVFPKEFIVDGEKGIKEAVGIQGVRLETEALVLGGFSPYKNNLTKAVLDSDLQILDIVPSPLASASAVLTQKQKELGVALLDVGAGTSELSVFEEGDLIHLAILPIGSANITNDIAIGLKTDIDTAERIKIEHGCCVFKGRDKKEKIETEEGELIFSQKQLAKIIEARVLEIFGEIKKELKKISKQELLPAGIVLTGGGAKLPKIAELAKKEFKLPCRIGKPDNFIGLDNDPSLATVCGLILGGADLGDGGWQKRFELPAVGGIGGKLKKIFRIFIP